MSEWRARLESLLELEDGWLDGEGLRPTYASIRLARATLGQLIGPPPRIYPTPEGGVQAEWTIGAWAADAEFDAAGTVIRFGATNGVSREGYARRISGRLALILAENLCSLAGDERWAVAEECA